VIPDRIIPLAFGDRVFGIGTTAKSTRIKRTTEDRFRLDFKKIFPYSEQIQISAVPVSMNSRHSYFNVPPEIRVDPPNKRLKFTKYLKKMHFVDNYC
jgi:hypothetical protein